MTTVGTMDLNAEAKRILAVSISKLYASRSQRGGLRLHRSLLLSQVMRSARDIYHAACAQATEEAMDTNISGQDEVPQSQPACTSTESETKTTPENSENTEEVCDSDMAEDKENMRPGRHSRKRRGKASAAPDFLPSKRARLEPGEERHAVPLCAGNVVHANCRTGETLTSLSFNRIISAF